MVRREKGRETRGDGRKEEGEGWGGEREGMVELGLGKPQQKMREVNRSRMVPEK